MRLLPLFVLLLTSVVPFGTPAEAGKRRSAPPTWEQAPVLKDCTRLNGRYGYYGNPWCTQAEQDAWDRATSRRVR
ncbi:MAG: hypothetical protein ACK4TP_01185 [Hyphomicrobium sp.]|jgi:hypothetical protein